MKKILIIKGHPRTDCFCNDLVDQYIEGAKTRDVEVRVLSLNELPLEPWLKYDWDLKHEAMPLSDELKRAQEMILWSDHMLFAYPTYWTAPPALVKLFLEAVVTSGFAFKYFKPLFGVIPRWHRLLKGRTASILSTMDAPPSFMNIIDRDPGGKMMFDTLEFVGIHLKHKYYFGPIVLQIEKCHDDWLRRAFRAGRADAK